MDVFRYGWGSLHRLVFYSKVQLTYHILLCSGCMRAVACVGSVETTWHHRPWSYYIDLFCVLNTHKQGQEWQHFCSQLSRISHMPRHGEVSSSCSTVHQATYQNIFYGGCQADNDDADGLGGLLISAFHLKMWQSPKSSSINAYEAHKNSLIWHFLKNMFFCFPHVNHLLH